MDKLNEFIKLMKKKTNRHGGALTEGESKILAVLNLWKDYTKIVGLSNEVDAYLDANESTLKSEVFTYLSSLKFPTDIVLAKSNIRGLIANLEAKRDEAASSTSAANTPPPPSAGQQQPPSVARPSTSPPPQGASQTSSTSAASTVITPTELQIQNIKSQLNIVLTQDQLNEVQTSAKSFGITDEFLTRLWNEELGQRAEQEAKAKAKARQRAEQEAKARQRAEQEAKARQRAEQEATAREATAREEEAEAYAGDLFETESRTPSRRSSIDRAGLRPLSRTSSGVPEPEQQQPKLTQTQMSILIVAIFNLLKPNLSKESLKELEKYFMTLTQETLKASPETQLQTVENLVLIIFNLVMESNKPLPESIDKIFGVANIYILASSNFNPPSKQEFEEDLQRIIIPRTPPASVLATATAPVSEDDKRQIEEFLENSSYLIAVMGKLYQDIDNIRRGVTIAARSSQPAQQLSSLRAAVKALIAKRPSPPSGSSPVPIASALVPIDEEKAVLLALKKLVPIPEEESKQTREYNLDYDGGDPDISVFTVHVYKNTGHGDVLLGSRTVRTTDTIKSVIDSVKGANPNQRCIVTCYKNFLNSLGPKDYYVPFGNLRLKYDQVELWLI